MQRQVKREAVPKECPALCTEQLSWPPGVAGRYIVSLPLSTGLIEKSAAGAETYRLVLLYILLPWVPDSVHVATLLLGSKST